MYDFNYMPRVKSTPQKSEDMSTKMARLRAMRKPKVKPMDPKDTKKKCDKKALCKCQPKNKFINDVK